MLLNSASGQIQPYDIAIDPYSRTLYWTCSMNNVVNVTRLDMTPVGVVLQAPNNFKPRSIALFPERGYVGSIVGQECGGPSKGLVCQLWSGFATVNRHICSGILCERDSAGIYNNWSSDQQLEFIQNGFFFFCQCLLIVLFLQYGCVT